VNYRRMLANLDRHLDSDLAAFARLLR